MPTDFADNSITKVEQSMKTEGATNAAHLLSKEFADYASSHTATETTAYWNKVQNKLGQDGMLVDLAIVWAKDKKSEVSRDGDLTPFDLKQVNRWSDGTALDKTMANTLAQNFDTLKKEHADPVGTTFGMGGSEKNAITSGDIDSRISRVEAERKTRVDHEQKVAEAKSLMTPLMATKDGNAGHTLLSTLDSLRGGTVDGRVGQDDLKRYLEEYKVRELTGEDMKGDKFNPATKQFVQKLLDNWNTAAVQRLKDGDSITADSLAKAGDFKDKNELVKSFQKS